jgi:hypothetical protein
MAGAMITWFAKSQFMVYQTAKKKNRVMVGSKSRQIEIPSATGVISGLILQVFIRTDEIFYRTAIMF